MNKTLGYILATAMSLSLANAQDALRIGVEGAYPPFSETNSSGEVIGFDIDMANALCEAMNRQCELIQVEWDGLIPAVKSRKIDAIIASMSITEERKKNVTFSEKYYQIPTKLARKKGADIELSQEGMKGKVVGVQNATIFDRYITDTFGDIVEIKRYSTQDEANADLVAGRLDAIIADSVVVSDGFLKTDAGKDYEFFGPDLTDPKYFGEGTGIAVDKGNDDLAAEFSQAVKVIRENGKYKEINDKYFDFDLYGAEN